MKFVQYLYFIGITIFFSNTKLAAQQKGDDLEKLYGNFLADRLNTNYDSAIALGEQILLRRSEFSEKRQLVFTYTLARMYEENNRIEKAVPLYKDVLEKEPNYYVPHRALGFYYLSKSNELIPQLKSKTNTAEQHKQNIEQYRSLLLQALPHLEKAYACDPDDETLTIIRNLMKTVGPKAHASDFEKRVAQLKSACVSILTE